MKNFVDRDECPMRHGNGNCTVAGGFCTAVNDPICEALHNAFYCGERSKHEIANRLAEYENTGLEPKEIQEAVDLFKDWKDADDIPKELKSWVERCTWHVRECWRLSRELDEYKKAETEGRLVVLPCKIGDTVYRVIRGKNGHGHISPATVSGLHLGDTTRNRRYRKEYEYVVLKVDGVFCAHVNKKDFGKTVFLTREEAEKALEGNNEQT